MFKNQFNVVKSHINSILVTIVIHVMANNGLYQLIHGLSTAEKRLITVNLQSSVGRSNNLKSVFSVVCSKSINSDLVLEEKLNPILIKNLSSTKHQLYHRILEVVSSSNSIFDSVYYTTALKIEYLISKELFKQALKMIAKLKTDVEKHERFLFKTDLYFKEIKALMGQKNYQECLKCFEEFQQEEVIVNEDNKSYMRAFNDYHRVNLHYFLKGAARSEEESIFYTKFIDSKEEVLKSKTLENSTNYFNLQGLSTAYFAIGNLKKSHDLTSRVLLMFDDAKHEKDSDLKQYLTVLYRFIAVLIFQGKYDDFAKHMEAFKSLKPRNIGEETYVKERFYNLWMLKYLISKQYDKAAPLMQDFEEDYARKSFELSPNIRPLLLGMCTSISMNLKDYKKALYWNNETLNSVDFNVLREDLIFATELFEIIIHYELENYRLLDYRLVSFQKKLKNKNKLYKVEELLIPAIERLIGTNVRSERNNILHLLGMELEKYKDDPFEKDLLNKFDFVTYFKSKID
jgi:hypothetical protein